MNAQGILFQVLNGLSFGALLFFLASGFTVIFGMMGIANLTHGSFFLLGGYIGLTAIGLTGNFFVGLLVGAVGVAVIGLLVERILLRPIRGQILPEVLLTLGLALVFADASLALWGGGPRSVPAPSFLNGAVSLGPLVYPRYRLFVMVCALVMGLVLYMIQRWSRVGAIVRAGVDNREMVAALGINIDRVFTGTFIFGAALAGFSGTIGGGFLGLVPGTDTEILLFALVVVILGGLGSLSGAAMGSLLVGLLDAFGKALFPSLSYFTLFAPMALILVLRPRGLLGRP